MAEYLHISLNGSEKLQKLMEAQKRIEVYKEGKGETCNINQTFFMLLLGCNVGMRKNLPVHDCR
jgi:hypothetical protein